MTIMESLLIWFHLAQLGGLTLGLSIAGAVFINVASNDLYDLLPNIPRNQVQQMVSGTSGTLLSSLSQKMHSRVLEIIVRAWNDVYAIPVHCPKPTLLSLSHFTL